MINGGRIPCRVRGLGGRKYLAMFIPTQPLPHIVEMSFNNEHVRMSPWSIPFVPEQHRNIYYHNSEQVSRAPDIRMYVSHKLTCTVFIFSGISAALLIQRLHVPFFFLLLQLCDKGKQ